MVSTKNSSIQECQCSKFPYEVTIALPIRWCVQLVIINQNPSNFLVGKMDLRSVLWFTDTGRILLIMTNWGRWGWIYISKMFWTENFPRTFLYCRTIPSPIWTLLLMWQRSIWTSQKCWTLKVCIFSFASVYYKIGCIIKYLFLWLPLHRLHKMLHHTGFVLDPSTSQIDVADSHSIPDPWPINVLVKVSWHVCELSSNDFLILTDFAGARPDEKAVMTYVSCYYHAFSGAQKVWELTCVTCTLSVSLFWYPPSHSLFSLSTDPVSILSCFHSECFMKVTTTLAQIWLGINECLVLRVLHKT